MRRLGWLLLFLIVPGSAHAVLDINDQGPRLDRANFHLRVTNAGIIGNAFLDQGLSNDASFESPAGSGQELLHYGALWVGARPGSGPARVSGGPLLEFRPRLDPEDRVRIGEFGRLGAARFFDDDGDGREDEESLDGRDEDGDGEVDEDLGMFAQQFASTEYVDDRPEAVQFVYAGGEHHDAMGLTVHQEAYAWPTPGYDRTAGLSWTIRNHGTQTLRDVYLGFYADLDSKLRQDLTGHLNDRITSLSYDVALPELPDTTHTRLGQHVCQQLPCTMGQCFTRLSQTLPALRDIGDDLPQVAAVGLWHTTDPLAGMDSDTARAYARAPVRPGFRYSVIATGRPAENGGPPITDEDRYRALRGEWPAPSTGSPGDFVVLVSCGPFPQLGPGESLEFHVALVSASGADSLASAVARVASLEHGVKFNLEPDYAGADSALYAHGESGRNGHEVCLEPPPGVQFIADPHCARRYINELGEQIVPSEPTPYRHGTCVWTDADCNGCTGQGGFDRYERWSDPGRSPAAPSFRVTPLDHGVRVEWDNVPEILVRAGQLGSESSFLGYRVWKLGDWRERPSLLPPRPRWALTGNFGPDTLTGQIPLASVTDSSLAHLRILYEQPQYPVGRYSFVDRDVLNGFDFVYAVTSVARVVTRDANRFQVVRIAETPLAAEFGQRVVPHASASDDPRGVWVVPNPFRGGAAWDRPQTYGDVLTRHIDFMGLPRARSTIRIYTLAGDFVAQLDHDGRNGDGETSWDLVSRNGQDVASGIYVFTVNSALGHFVGRFVIIR